MAEPGRGHLGSLTTMATVTSTAMCAARVEGRA
jgi:hypothetical protein